jgi:uncharacterized protein YcfJ
MKNRLGMIGAAGAVLLALGACSSGGGHRTTVSERERVYRDDGQVCRETEVVERDRRDGGNRAAGTVAGAVVGGVIGHQIGSGRGNDAATVGGAAAGAYAGNQLAKDRGGKVRSREVTTECRSRY